MGLLGSWNEMTWVALCLRVFTLNINILLCPLHIVDVQHILLKESSTYVMGLLSLRCNNILYQNFI